MLCIPAAEAGAAIAKVSKFSGEAVIQSGEKIVRLTAAGALLNDGDRIQTRQGEVEVLFNDGAVMRINPFSNAMLQEKTEEGGFWIFKSTQEARRITCLVGKLFFQSGVSAKKNYLQTPTVVAGIRGSSGDIGFDNLNSYLNMYVGEAAVLGNVIRGVFANPGATAAQRNTVYQALAGAYEKAQQAAATGRAVEIAQARVTASEVGRQVAQLLQTNPDPVVKANAALIGQMSEAFISAATARVAVEQIREEKAAADKAVAEARRKGDTEKTRQAEQASQRVEQERIQAEQQAAAAAAAAQRAAAAAAAADLARVRKAAEEAEKAAEKARESETKTRELLRGVVTTTLAPTTAPTTAATTAAATTAATTAETTSVTTVDDRKGKPADTGDDKTKKRDTTVGTTVATTTSVAPTTFRSTTSTSSSTTIERKKDKEKDTTTTFETTYKTPSP